MLPARLCYSIPTRKSGRSILLKGGDIASEVFERLGSRSSVRVIGSSVRAPRRACLILLGGTALEGLRYVWWNFVSVRKERIEQAKEDWKERFTPVPGERRFIPLPDTQPNQVGTI